MSGLDGPGSARLKALGAALKRLPRGARAAVLKATADEAEALAQLGFVESRSPKGETWAPLKYRDGQPLRLTTGAGGLQASVVGRPTGRGIRLGTTKEYAAHHQFGAPRAKIPQRQFLPMQGEALSDEWEGALCEAADEALALVLRRLGLL